MFEIWIVYMHYLTLRNLQQSFYIPFFILAFFLVNGCSVSHFDNDTQTLHVIGFTHVKMRVPRENEGKAVLHQVNSYGIAAGSLREGSHLTIGYSENTLLDISGEQLLCFEWPTESLIDVKVDNSNPFMLNGVCKNESEERNTNN